MDTQTHTSQYEDVNREIHDLLTRKPVNTIHQYTEQRDILPLLETLNRTYSEINACLKTEDSEGLKNVILKSDIKMSLVCETLLNTLRETVIEKNRVAKELSEASRRARELEEKEVRNRIEIERLREEVECRAGNVNELNRVIKDQKDRMTEYKDETYKCKSEANILRVKVTELENLRAKAAERMGVFEKEIEVLNEYMKNKADEIVKLEAEKKEEENKNLTIKSKILEMERMIEVLNRKNETRERNLSLCNSELSRVLVENKAMKTEMDKLRDSSVYYQNLYKSVSKQNEYLNGELSKMIGNETYVDVRKYKKKLRKSKRRISYLKNKIGEKSYEVNDSASVDDSYKAENVKVDKSADENDSLIKRIDELTEKNRNYRERIEGLESEKKEIEDKVRSLEKGVKSDHKMKNDHKQELRRDYKPSDYKAMPDYADYKVIPKYSDYKSSVNYKPSIDYKPSTDYKPSIDYKPSTDYKPSIDYKPSSDYKPAYTDYKPSIDYKPAYTDYKPIYTDYPNIDYKQKDLFSNFTKPLLDQIDSQNYMKLHNLENSYDNKKEDDFIGGFQDGSTVIKTDADELRPSNLRNDIVNEHNLMPDRTAMAPNTRPAIETRPSYKPISTRASNPIDDPFEDLSDESIKTYHTTSTLKEMMARTENLQKKFQNLEQQLADIKEDDSEDKLSNKIKTYNNYYSDWNIDGNNDDIL